MSEKPTIDPEEQEEDGLLAKSLMSNAAFSNFEKRREKFEQDLGRGAVEQAKEHLNRMEDDLRLAWYNEVNPNLTDAENLELQALREKIYPMDEDDYFLSSSHTEEDEQRLKELEDKAYPEEDDS
jgi:hypothetical protein